MSFWKDFSEENKAGIRRAIEVAELNTSGEIRVHIEDKCAKNEFDRAVEVFAKLEMHKTKLRNGILFYVAVSDKKFVIIGDAGINERVPENFWEEIKETVFGYFRNGKFTEGLMEGIRMAGEQLQEHFPYEEDDKNELSNDISFGKTE